MKAVFDTNMLIDYLNGVNAARIELERDAQREISIVTWAPNHLGTQAPRHLAPRHLGTRHVVGVIIRPA